MVFTESQHNKAQKWLHTAAHSNQKNNEIKDARKPIEAISKLVENLESDDKAQQSQTRLIKCKS
jgi:hypothetical protein